MKLNLGCGNMYLEGYVNIDRSPVVRADDYYDIALGLKENNNTVNEIFAGCVLEQLSHESFMFVLNECNRVLVTGGILTGYVPSTDARVLHLDPADKLFFQIGTFDYFNANKHQWQNFGRNYGLLGWSNTEAHINDNGILHFTLTK